MGPGKDTHGTLGPVRGKAVGGPINAPQGEVTHNDGAVKRDNRQVGLPTNKQPLLQPFFSFRRKAI